MIDENELFYYNLQSDLIRYAISQNRFIDAFKLSDSLMDGDLINTTSYFRNVTGLKQYFNYLYTDPPSPDSNFAKLVTSVEHRRQIHVGNATFHGDDLVETYLMGDVFQSVPWEKLTALFNNYKVLIYNGLLDLICPEISTVSWIENLEWEHAAEYRKAQRQIWKVHPDDPEVAGYIKIVNRFLLAAVRNAGHMVPTDQPRAMLDLLKRFIQLT